jgi:hypothetical protein
VENGEVKDYEKEPFSVWGFIATRLEDGAIVEWKEEFEHGTAFVRVVVRSEDEFAKQVIRFGKRVIGTWPLL